MKCLPVATVKLICILALPAGSAALNAADKSDYYLWNPTPASEMREMTTDRPDKTETPFTVDAGHWQLESDLVGWSRDRDGGSHDSLDVGRFNVRVGLTNAFEVNVVSTIYHYERHRVDGSRETSEGFDDISLRAKYNLWGNDGGRTALAVLPFVTLPSSKEEFGVPKAEAGFVLPLSIDLGGRWGMGIMTGLAFVNDDYGGHETVSLNTISLGFDITEAVGAFVEFAAALPVERSAEWEGYVDFGLTWGMTPNLQLDTGINFGVSEAAEDLGLFVGVSYRL